MMSSMLISFPISDKRVSKTSSKLPTNNFVCLLEGQGNIHEYEIIEIWKAHEHEISENLEAGQMLQFWKGAGTWIGMSLALNREIMSVKDSIWFERPPMGQRNRTISQIDHLT
jgi:muconolactone delta-isomerase